jgi:proteasome lid subunit RPN8/RPN11
MVEDVKNRIKILSSSELSVSAPIPLSQIPHGSSFGAEGSIGHFTLYRCEREAEHNKPCEVIFPQTVYQTVMNHLSQDTTREHGGFLLGYETFLDSPRTPAIMITEAVPAEFTEGTPVRLTFTTDTWRRLDDLITEKYRESPLTPQRVGWYHSHPNIAIFLSHWDLDVCTTFNCRKYPVALVVDPVKNRGGFFIRGEKGYVPHSPQGFYEAHNLQEGPMVAWNNLTRAEEVDKKEASGEFEPGAPSGGGFKIVPGSPKPHRAAFVSRVVLGLAMAIMVAAIGVLFIHERRDAGEIALLVSEVDKLKQPPPGPPSLVPVQVSVSPPDALLAASEHQDFKAIVGGAENTKVNWSISPEVGSISTKGRYTAPRSIKNETLVTVLASSFVDSSKIATATVTLRPKQTPIAIRVSINPVRDSLRPRESKHFSAEVTGPGRHMVTWSINPADLGEINRETGLYTATSPVSSSTKVQVIATSKDDASKSAKAIVTLLPASSSPQGGSDTGSTAPPASGEIRPPGSESTSLEVKSDRETLSEEEHANLTANVGGKKDNNVDWTLNEGAVGKIESGRYVAPAEIKADGDSVTITATTRTDPKRSGSLKLTLRSRSTDPTMPR